MDHYAFGYHSSRATEILTPRNSDFNIKGVELEINDDCLSVREQLDDMIYRHLIYAPNMNGYNAPSPVVICDDSTVYKELIIKACGNRKLMETVRMLDNELGGFVENTSNTSCHVHVNKRYLRKIGIQTKDLFKTAEFFAPILYRISGRDLDTQYDWAKTLIGNIETINLYERAKQVDELEIDNSGAGRYYVLNCKPGHNSAEFRIFSNYCNFDSKMIKLYIDIIDFMMDITKEINSYEEQYDFIMNETKKFFKKRSHKKFFYEYSLDEFFLTKEELKTRMIRKQCDELRRKFDSVRRNMEYESQTNSLMRLLRIIRDYEFELPTIELQYDGNDIDRVEEILIQDLENELTNR